MLTHPTHGRLVALGLTGMAKALDEQRRQPDIAAFAFEERLALLVDREAPERENKRLITRLRVRQPSTKRRRRGRRHEGAARARQGAVPQARRRRLDRSASEPDRHRPDRRRQELDRVRARSHGLPRRSLRPLSSRAAAVRCARRWHAATAVTPGCSRASPASSS